MDAWIAVHQIDERETDGRRDKAVERMQYRVPHRKAQIEGLRLSQDLRTKDEQQQDDLQRRRQLDLELHLNDAGNDQQEQGEQTQKDVFVVAVEQLQDRRQDDERPQQQVDGKWSFMLTDLHLDRLHGSPPSFFHSHLPLLNVLNGDLFPGRAAGCAAAGSALRGPTRHR